jgi:hypothetical protein
MNHAHGMPQNGGPPMPSMRAPTRNVALVVVGVLVFVLGLGAGVVFLINLNQYLTVGERWESNPLLSPEGRRFGISIIEHAAMKRMTLFGPLSAGLGITGFVLFLFGLRKK